MLFTNVTEMKTTDSYSGASTDVTARGVNALATWMIDHPLDEGGEEMSPAGGVASPSELPTPPSPEMPALIGER